MNALLRAFFVACLLASGPPLLWAAGAGGLGAGQHHAPTPGSAVRIAQGGFPQALPDLGCAAEAQTAWGGDCPDLYFLAIALERYRDPEIPTLNYSVDDAESLLWLARTQAGKLYREVHAKVLTNEQATLQEVRRAINVFYRQARPQDVLVLTLLGHGAVDPVTDRYFFFTYDTLLRKANERGNLEVSFGWTALGEQDILNLVLPGGEPPQRLLMLFDTCQSGRLTGLSEGTRGRGRSAPRGLAELMSKEETSGELPGGTVTLQIAASGADQASAEVDFRCAPDEPAGVTGHGVLSCSVLRAAFDVEEVHRREHPNFLSFDDLDRWVVRDVPRIGTGIGQTPDTSPYYGDGGRDLPIFWRPTSVEECDGRDNTLDGLVDMLPSGQTVCKQDEICNGEDDDLDGVIDEGVDRDGDGFVGGGLCPEDRRPLDCDDGDAAISPGADEVCDLWGDEDCDGRIDEGHDQDDNQVPDCYQAQVKEVRARVGLGIGGTIALSLGAGYLAYQAGQIVEGPETHSVPSLLGGAAGFSPDASSLERARSVTALSWGSLGATVLISVPITVGIRSQRIRRALPPRGRYLSGASVQGVAVAPREEVHHVP